jgi:hypothetical protein
MFGCSPYVFEMSMALQGYYTNPLRCRVGGINVIQACRARGNKAEVGKTVDHRRVDRDIQTGDQAGKSWKREAGVPIERADIYDGADQIDGVLLPMIIHEKSWSILSLGNHAIGHLPSDRIQVTGDVLDGHGTDSCQDKESQAKTQDPD